MGTRTFSAPIVSLVTTTMFELFYTTQFVIISLFMFLFLLKSVSLCFVLWVKFRPFACLQEDSIPPRAVMLRRHRTPGASSCFASAVVLCYQRNSSILP